MARLLIALMIVWVGLCVPAHAEDEIMVRTGVHPSYVRVVFDWPTVPVYSVEAGNGAVTIRFDRPANADISSLLDRDTPNIRGADIVSKPGEPLAISIKIPSGGTHRAFVAGERVVLDIYNSDQSDIPPLAAVKESRSVPASESAKPKAGAEKPEPPKPVTPKQEGKLEPVPPASAQQVTPVEGQPLEALKLEPHTITITSTRALGVAAYRRGGALWIVVNDPQLKADPLLEGPQKDSFAAMQRHSIDGGIAYRLPLPENTYVYAEGGGLIWKFVITPMNRETKPVLAERRFGEGDLLRGGTLLWPFKGERRVLDVPDPGVGDVVMVLAINAAGQAASAPQEFVELETLPSIVGLALVPRVDDLEVKSIAEGVIVTRPAGLVLSRPSEKPAADEQEKTDAAPADKKPDPVEVTRIYNFKTWEMGGKETLNENQRILYSEMNKTDESARVENILTLAKLNLANDRGPEALGFLRLAGEELEGIDKNPEFIALRGAAASLSQKNDEAILDLLDKTLDPYTEVNYWRAFTLAGLDDWQQAAAVLPPAFDILLDYPVALRVPLALRMAEITLRAGKMKDAESLLAMLETLVEKLPLPYRASWSYLMGETQRQLGNKEKAKEFWTALTKGEDDLFRAKAGLALTRLQLEGKEITPTEAIDKLEGLRYAWRGDELETLVNYRLAQVYIDSDEYLKGLVVLRNAITLTPSSNLTKEMSDYLTKSFQSIFTKEGIRKISPLEAVGLYEEFSDLIPPEVQDTLVEELAEKMVEADLLGRASVLFQKLIDTRLQGDEQVRIATRLGAIHLLDSKPDQALRSLDRAQKVLEEVAAGKPVPADKVREINLLKARAYSQMSRPDEAIAILDTMAADSDVNSLKADISWKAGRWDGAADALQEILTEEDISPARPLTARQRDLVLNRAVALNLANNRVALSNLRERYGDAMRQTDKAQLFDVITRPRQAGISGSRDAIGSIISEVDMFKDFLKMYKNTGGQDKPIPAEADAPPSPPTTTPESSQ